MTTIVGYADPDGTVYIAGDHRVTEPETGKYWDSELTPKVAASPDGALVYGVAGDQPIMERIILGWTPPTRDQLSGDAILDTYAVIRPSIVECVGDLDGDWVLLLGIHGAGLLLVDAQSAVHNDRANVEAVGSGSQYALGYMYATPRYDEFRRSLTDAIRTAAARDLHTSSSSTVVKTRAATV